MNKSTDIIVVGGGINGVCTAFYLAQKGIHVSLIEKSFIAGGPTGLSSAIVRQHYSNPVTARMALKSLRVWQNFSEITGSETVFTNVDFMIGVRPEDIDGLKANIALQQDIGIDTRFISREEIKEIDPKLNTEGLGGGAYEPESGYCDPAAAAAGFAEAAKSSGAIIHTGMEVIDIHIDQNKVVGVVTDRGEFSAGGVVIAAGPWTPMLLANLGIEIPIETARVKVVLYQKPPELGRHGIWADFISQIYLRPETGGMMLVGSISPEEETGDRIDDPDDFNQIVEMDIISNFAERTAMRYPAMENSHVHSSYASLYDISPDWHHILDTAPGVDGLYICAGSSGHGFKLAPAVGEMMAELVINGKNPDDDISLFSFDRFKSGSQVQGQYEYSILA